MKTEYPFEDKTALKHKQETKEPSAEELLYKHDISIMQIEHRLNSLENLVHQLHEAIPIYYVKKEINEI